MGIIDVSALYGLSSIIKNKQIHMVISIETWKQDENYDRLGTEDEYTEILNTRIKKMKIPIRPGRNVAVIIEAAAANYRYGLISNITPADTIDARILEEARKREQNK